MAAPQTEVLVTVGGTEHSGYLFRPGDYVIGRNLDCAVCVEAGQVSRQHVKLILDYDNAFIEDLGSSNGTRVNGKPVHGRTRLRPNQKVQCGAATIELRRLRRLRRLPREASELSLSPTTAFVGQALPPEMLREKKYDIGNIVAVGGMGEVLDAKEAALVRRVAMKTMLGPASKDEIQRFINEARITGQFEHPNIVPVHELSVDEYDQVFYTMKLVKGATLKAVIERLANGEAAAVKQYPPATLLTAFQKVCDAVAFAHSKKVLHRDLKPENIMLGEYGEVLMMDWGLAKILVPARAAEGAIYEETERSGVCAANDSSDTGSMTMEGTILGTPKYMSPEQARGENDTLTTRSDIYLLAAAAILMRLPSFDTRNFSVLKVSPPPAVGSYVGSASRWKTLHKMQWPGFCVTTRNCACTGFPGRLHLLDFPPKSSLQKHRTNRHPKRPNPVAASEPLAAPIFTHSLSLPKSCISKASKSSDSSPSLPRPSSISTPA